MCYLHHTILVLSMILVILFVMRPTRVEVVNEPYDLASFAQAIAQVYNTPTPTPTRGAQ
jgi:hypothetical protein